MNERDFADFIAAGGTIGVAPEGWKPISVNNDRALCHSNGLWWQGPDGKLYCGTCYVAPWLGVSRIS